MYWSDWGSKPAIEQAYLDGSHREALVTENIRWPNGLCVDFSTNRIYWADAKLDRIETADLDGGNRVQLVTNLPHPFGLAVVNISTVVSS